MANGLASGCICLEIPLATYSWDCWNGMGASKQGFKGSRVDGLVYRTMSIETWEKDTKAKTKSCIIND